MGQHTKTKARSFIIKAQIVSHQTGQLDYLKNSMRPFEYLEAASFRVLYRLATVSKEWKWIGRDTR